MEGRLKGIVRQEANEEHLAACGEVEIIKACGISAHSKCIPRLHPSWRRVHDLVLHLADTPKAKPRNRYIDITIPLSPYFGFGVVLIEECLLHRVVGDDSASSALGKLDNVDLQLCLPTTPA